MSGKQMKPVVKYLLIAIAFFAQVLLVAGISIFVYKSYAAKSDPKNQIIAGEKREVVEAKYEFEEFKVPTIDPGMCMFKIEVYLNDKDIAKKFDEELSYIRDNIARIAMNYTVDGIKLEYREGKLHRKLLNWLNLK